jgi:hypothetical protein
MSEFKNIYVIFGREDFETDVADVDRFFDLSEENSIFVFVSPSYLLTKTKTLETYPNVFRVIEPISNVFAPEWRQNSTEYTALRWLMYADDVPTYYCTFNEDIFDDMDYYAHVHNFKNKNRVLFDLTDPENEQVIEEPLESRITDPEIKVWGDAHYDVFKAAGYDTKQNGPVPGWALQLGSPWLTRLCDLYRLRTTISREAVPFRDYDSLNKIAESIENPTTYDSAYISRDLRMSLTESSATRAHITRLTKDLLRL